MRLRKYIGITVTVKAIIFLLSFTCANAPIIPMNKTMDWMAVQAKIMVIGVSLYVITHPWIEAGISRRFSNQLLCKATILINPVLRIGIILVSTVK